MNSSWKNCWKYFIGNLFKMINSFHIFPYFFSLDNDETSYDDHGGSSNGNTFSMRPMGTNPFIQVLMHSQTFLTLKLKEKKIFNAIF